MTGLAEVQPEAESRRNIASSHRNCLFGKKDRSKKPSRQVVVVSKVLQGARDMGGEVSQKLSKTQLTMPAGDTD